jgi:hypothetical protein
MGGYMNKTNRHFYTNFYWVFELIGITLITICFIAYFFVTHGTLSHLNQSFSFIGDRHAYIYMAEHDYFSFHLAPYCWRIFVPFLVRFIGGDIEANFFAISYLCLLFSGVLFYYFLKSWNFSKWYSFIGLLLYLANPYTIKYLSFDFWLVDSAAFIILIASMYCIRRKNDVVLSFLLIIGVLIKESILFLIPLYYTLNSATLFDKRMIKKTLFISIAPLTVFFGIRCVIPSMNIPLYVSTLTPWPWHSWLYETGYSLRILLTTVFQERAQFTFWQTLESLSIGSFGIFIFLIIFSKLNFSLFWKFSPFIILSYCQLLFAEDTQRLLVIALPLLIILELNGLRSIVDTIIRIINLHLQKKSKQ